MKTSRSDEQRVTDVIALQEKIEATLSPECRGTDVFDALLGMVAGIYIDAPENIKTYFRHQITKMLVSFGTEVHQIDEKEFMKMKQAATEKALLS